MRAVTVTGEHTVAVADRPDPEPGAGELLVRVAAAGLNSADLAQVAGKYPAPPGSPPDIPGLELAGTVEATGPGVPRFSPGDRVMAVVGGGGQAELAVVHERLAMPVPDGLAWPEAGGLPEAFTTAHDALFSQCGLGLGERLLVNGAAGGVGTAAVQLGVAAGARVTASVRHPEHREALKTLGAEVVDAGHDPAATDPFDVVLELVGAPNLAADLKALATGGRIMIIGVGAGARAELDLLGLMQRKGRVLGSTLRSRPLEQKAAAARAVEAAVLPGFEAGALRVPVAATYPLEQAPDAYEHFAQGGKLGKIVLVAEGD